MTLALATAYSLLAVLLIATRLWLRYPVFTLLMLAYGPILAAWDPRPATIPPSAAALLGLKLGAVLEALWHATEEETGYRPRSWFVSETSLPAVLDQIAIALNRLRRLILMLAAFLGGAAATWVWERAYVQPAVTEYQAIHGAAHLFYSVFCLCGILACWQFVQWVDPRDRWHGAILTLFMLNQSRTGLSYLVTLLNGQESAPAWLSARTPYLAGCLVLMAAWCAWSTNHARRVNRLKWREMW